MGLLRFLRMGRAVEPSLSALSMSMPPAPPPGDPPDPEQAGRVPRPPPLPSPGEPHPPGTGSGGGRHQTPAGGSCAGRRPGTPCPGRLCQSGTITEPGRPAWPWLGTGDEGSWVCGLRLHLGSSLERPAPGDGPISVEPQLLLFRLRLLASKPLAIPRLPPHRADRAGRSPHRRLPRRCSHRPRAACHPGEVMRLASSPPPRSQPGGH